MLLGPRGSVAAAYRSVQPGGGILLDTVGSESFPWTVLLLLLPAIAVVLYARKAGIPAHRPVPETGTGAVAGTGAGADEASVPAPDVMA